MASGYSAGSSVTGGTGSAVLEQLQEIKLALEVLTMLGTLPALCAFAALGVIRLCQIHKIMKDGRQSELFRRRE
jgi:hypothetical protein